MHVRVVVVLVIAVGVFAASPANAVEGEVVRATEMVEAYPAATDTYLTWNELRRRWDAVFAAPFGGAKVRVSERGTNGWNGSIEGSVVTYQQWDNRSDIYTFDLVTRERSKLRPVNSPAWEYRPSRSGDIVAFARWFPSQRRQVIVYDLASDTARTIARTRGRNRLLLVGQASGNWVVYEKTSFRNRAIASCDVYRYDVATDTTVKIPNPRDRCQYAPSVDPSGTVYFARSGFACGTNAVLRVSPDAGSAETMTERGRGHDLFSTYAVDNGDGSVDLYYDPGRCPSRRSIGQTDIYRLTWPEPT